MKKIYILIFLFLFTFFPLRILEAQSLAQKLAGRILLQVEGNGEAWYVSPNSLMRVYLGNPADAINMMKKYGIGISNKNINKIPVGVLSSGILLANNNNSTLDLSFAGKQKGKILIQTEGHGEAWYVYPVDGKRYYLGRPADAFAVMRSLGLGIKNSELLEISSLTPDYNLSVFEDKVFNLINVERKKAGLPALANNKDLATVAREHSKNLADENLSLTDFNKACDFPFIHHEGYTFGLYAHNRLNTRGIFYFGKSGENIALMPGEEVKTVYYNYDDQPKNCSTSRKQLENKYDDSLESEKDETKKLQMVKVELAARQQFFNQQEDIKIASIKWNTQNEVAQKTVDGWMASPGHKANILDSEYDEAGIGAAYVNGYLITTQVFIKHATCGYSGGACCEKTGYYPYCFKPFSCKENKCG